MFVSPAILSIIKTTKNPGTVLCNAMSDIDTILGQCLQLNSHKWITGRLREEQVHLLTEHHTNTIERHSDFSQSFG